MSLMILAETNAANSPVSGRCFGVETGPQPKAEILHDACPGRVRFRHMGLRGRARLAHAVETALGRLPGVIAVRSSELTGSTLVEFRSPMTVERLTRALDAAAAGELTPSPATGEFASEVLSENDLFHAEPIERLAAWLKTRLSDGLTTE